MATEKWYDSDDPTRVAWGIGRTVAVVVGFIVIIILIGTLLAWGFGIVTAPWQGKGSAYKQQQSGTNRVFAQQLFHELYNDYQATVAKIPIYKEQASTSYQAQTNLTGLESHCNDVVAQYNAASNKYLTKDFKDANLPVALSYESCH